MDRIHACCDYLLDLRRQKLRVSALPSNVRPESLADGYRVQGLLVDRLLEQHGGKKIGYKIACTSELAQEALGVDAPFFGVLLSATTFASGAKIVAANHLVRCAEAEFGFEMAADAPGGPTYTADSIRDFIGTVIPSIEIVDHRYLNWQVVGAPSLLADNAIHGVWVTGEPTTNWRNIDFATHPTALIVNRDQRFSGSALRCWAIRSTWWHGWPTNCRSSAASSRRGTRSPPA